jgi:hypothetical protein
MDRVQCIEELQDDSVFRHPTTINYRRRREKKKKEKILNEFDGCCAE